jgi:hypothetical protein
MRSTDERLREILRRTEPVMEKRRLRRHIGADALTACVCLVLLLAVSLSLPRLAAGPVRAAREYGSLLLTGPYLGLVIVVLLAFALGVCVTLLCLHLKRLKEKERERERK